jgi:hypothetical protein
MTTTSFFSEDISNQGRIFHQVPQRRLQPFKKPERWHSPAGTGESRQASRVKTQPALILGTAFYFSGTPSRSIMVCILNRQSEDLQICTPQHLLSILL